ncbi:SH3 domain-containing protein 19 isoform X2 [Triplophysa rosa]|uniref:SH3 domain-containing protein 19 isoform X2 n=1 Tax=Triplophysa rosa TaxID=992332 RepID=UPI002545C945|nr:SH3 domain-containing protein 19 isoform X2 [Triplophysa rosa]
MCREWFQEPLNAVLFKTGLSGTYLTVIQSNRQCHHCQLCMRTLGTECSKYRSERNKPEHIYVSQGPLSSIKAAFKRTSARAHSQTDYTRERRRPEITILSAEPLTATSWFQGACGRAFTTTQSVWSENILSPVQLPPSYDQVIKEKTQEQDTTPTPLPRRSLTTTIATQTDTLEQNATNPDSKTPLLLIQQHRSAVSSKQPKKPPRPSLPSNPKVPQTSPKQLCSDEENTISIQPCVNAKNCSNTSTASLLTPIQHPVPRPRSKTKQSPTSQVNVPPLIPLQDSWEVDPVTPVESSNGHSGKYLKELLDVFSSEPYYDLSNPVNFQEKKTDQPAQNLSENMTALHIDRNIRAKIQAFESQSNVENDETATPLPRPRKAYTKPPVLAPKPSIAPRPSIRKPKEEELQLDNHINEDVKTPPTPAPRPQSFKKTSSESKDESDFQPPFRTIPIPPSRPSLVRVKNVSSQEEELVFKGPPSPLKPSQDLLNFNNHNSTALLSNVTSTDNIQTSDFVDAAINYSPIKPGHQGGFSYTGPNIQGVTRRPTVIRVPSKTDKYLEEVTGVPPALPVQKAVGGPPTPAKPSLKDSFSLLSDVSLPPRPSGGKVLPPRPPPAKANPGRPPPPQKGGSLRRPNDNTVPQGVSIKLQQPQSQQPNRRASRKGPALPPRPNPGRSLYNKYTLEIPHGIAQFDYNGTNTGELSFQKNEVLVLLDQLDSKTFECQVGNAEGTVQMTHMKIITPLTNLPYTAPQKNNPSPTFSGVVVNTGSLQVQALYDFTPEGPGELALRAGDVVSNVEQLDSEWYMGTCRNMTGFFPINYVKTQNKPVAPAPVSSNEWKPKPAPAAISGPRCVARFDFEGEQGGELSFSEGDVIQLLEYVEDEWASGKLNGHVGIFPLNYVEVLEDLPRVPVQKSAPNKIALPGMAGLTNTLMSHKANEAEGVWAKALYDFTAETEDDLPFQQGDQILVTAHTDDEWWSGRINGREGIFPKAFVEVATGGWK